MIKLPSDSLKLALAGLSKVISTRSTLPVLQCVRIERAFDVTTITATNLDQTLTATLPREFPFPSSPLAVLLAEARWARESEAMVVSFGLLKQVLRSADKGTEIAVENRDGMPFVLYTFNGQECAAPGAESFKLDEFPVDVDEIELEPFAHFGPSERTAVVEALGMSSQDESRYILNGFLLSTKAIVSTDGRRMYYSPIPRHLGYIPLPGSSLDVDLVVPYMEILRHPSFLSQDWTLSYAPAVERRRKPNGEEIRQHLAEYEEACRRAESLQEDKPKWKPLKSVKETVGGNHLRIVSDLDEYHLSWTLKTKLIEGNYPNFMQVIPTTYDALVTLSETTRLEFIDLLNRMPKSDENAVKLDFAPLGIGIEHGKHGQIKLWLDGVTMTGADNLLLAVNRHWLAESLQTGTCEIRLGKEKNTPIVFVARGGKFVVQMPLALPEPAPEVKPETAPEATEEIAA